MKTKRAIPDTIFWRAKSAAVARGVPFREFVSEAVKDKLAPKTRAGVRPWMKLVGKLKHLHAETRRINRLIEEDSEKIVRKMKR